MRQEQFLRYKEWEFITFPLEVVEINDPTSTLSFGPGTSMTITRNQDYRLQGKITGFTMNRAADQPLQGLNMLSLDPSLGAQAAASGLDMAKKIVSRKVKQVKVTITGGYQVLLKDMK